MNFEIIYSDSALTDLRNIYRYIVTELLAPDAAKRISESIMSAAESLEEMPFRNPTYDKEPWKSRGLRKLIVDNFIVFYLPIEHTKQVLIVTIMYGKRNVENVLNEIEIETEKR